LSQTEYPAVDTWFMTRTPESTPGAIPRGTRGARTGYNCRWKGFRYIFR